MHRREKRFNAPFRANQLEWDGVIRTHELASSSSVLLTHVRFEWIASSWACRHQCQAVGVPRDYRTEQSIQISSRINESLPSVNRKPLVAVARRIERIARH